MNDAPSYDGRIDWARFYTERVIKPRVSGGKITGMCIFHENTRTPSWWASLDSGMWKCESCGATGNPTTWLAKFGGITNKDANAMLLDMAGVVREPKRPARARGSAAYDVTAYAAEKHLDLALLTSWGVTTHGGSVAMPYLPGLAVRKRNNPEASRRFAWQTERVDGVSRMVGEMSLYGLWLMPTWDAAAPVVLVEGESDAHALWSLGIPALGVPGASSYQAAWTTALRGRDVYLHDEGDDGGHVFVERTAARLAEGGHDAAVYVFSTPGEVKDPSDLYVEHGDAAGDMLREAMRGAVRRDVDKDASVAEKQGVLASRGLVKPSGWHIDERGIFKLSDDRPPRMVTATPIVISRRSVDAAGGGERIGLAFLRDGAWVEVLAARDEAFSTRSIVGILAPLGCHITSESSKDVVRWLGALESMNLSSIVRVRSTSSLGWCGDAFMPVMSKDVVLDTDGSADTFIDAFRPQGSLEEWCAMVAPLREDERHVARFILAAGLASTLLRGVGGRTFFVYNWGSSKGGKTAAVKAALSAWGDPEMLMTTFNATQVGLERLASLMKDLPLGIDERQMAGGDQSKLDQVVYQLASGTGRVRGTRDGGMQQQTHWRCVVLATGEEPLSGSVSQTGVTTRVLELFGVPFTSEDEAAKMHVSSATVFGTAGPEFVRRLVDGGEARAVAIYDTLLAKLAANTSAHASSHLAGVATVCTADALMSEWLFGQSAADAVECAEVLGLQVLTGVEEAVAGDVDEAAILWLEGWLASNVGRFSSTSNPPVFGDRGSDGTWRVYPSVLREAIERAGFSYRKTMKALEKRSMIAQLGRTGTGNVTHATVQRVHGASTRCVVLDMAKQLSACEVTSDEPF